MIITKGYNRENAVKYAREWALSRNPLFVDFTGIGGDCTNFVSQCILAGSCTMNFTKDFGWYYISSADRAPAWTGVEFFYDFMTRAPEFLIQNHDIGPYATEVRRRFAEIGDAIQLANSNGDYYHTLIISEITDGEIFVCAHSDDALDRPLSSYNYYTQRFLHIEGVKDNIYQNDCFDALINGIALPISLDDTTGNENIINNNNGAVVSDTIEQ